MDARGGAGHADSKSLESYGGHHHDHHHHNRQCFITLFRQIVLLFGLVVVTCYVLYPSDYPFLPHSSYNQDKGAVKLEKILEKVAMEDKTLIITTLNGAWAARNSIFDLFLKSFRIGNETSRFLNHLVVIAVDQTAYDRCLVLHPHCYVLSTTGVDLDLSGEASYLTTTYLEMSWRKIDLLHSILKLGYNFIYTDADIMWFRDPFPHFYPDADFQISCDFFWGNTWDLENEANTGFIYVKSNKHTIKLYKFWYTSREAYPGLHDQYVLNKIKLDPLFTTKVGVKIRFLDTAYFGGFCQPSKDLNQVCSMHANCCLGLGSKAHELKVLLEDWKKFLSLPSHVRASQSTSWTEPQTCSIKNFQLPHSPKKKVQQGSNNES